MGGGQEALDAELGFVFEGRWGALWPGLSGRAFAKDSYCQKLCGRKAKFLEEEKKEHLAFRMFREESES